MSARQATYELMRRLESRGLAVSFDDANTLRRAEITLQRWSEQECGDSSDYASYSIERDETSGIPYRCIYPHTSGAKSSRYRIPDREAGALRRVADVCKRIGAHYYHQGDPRGCSLYVDREPIPDNNYTRAICCAVEV